MQDHGKLRRYTGNWLWSAPYLHLEMMSAAYPMGKIFEFVRGVFEIRVHNDYLEEVMKQSLTFERMNTIAAMRDE